MGDGTMDAGRELDALIAERVMGWEVVWHTDPNWKGIRQPFRVIVRAESTDRSREEMLPRFSTKMDAAWKVVEKVLMLPRAGFDLRNYGTWTAVVTLGLRSFSEDADTAPLAICRAALAALSVPEGDAP